jgi:hypothetical protein
MTCARTHGVIDALAEVGDEMVGLADLGHEGAADVVRVPIKEPSGKKLTDDQKTYNKLIRGIRGIGERADALLIVRFKALRRVSLAPWRIGAISVAALVLLHHENDRTISRSHMATSHRERISVGRRGRWSRRLAEPRSQAVQ